MDVVLIAVSAETRGIFQNAYPYPKEIKNTFYKVPIFRLYIQKKQTESTMPPKPYRSESNVKADYEWDALRFMPYYNGNAEKKVGVAGLYQLPVTRVDSYDRTFCGGGIHLPIDPKVLKQTGLKDNFYIHGGPEDLINWSSGAEGCVGIIGKYHDFLENILSLLGFKNTNNQNFTHDRMEEIIRDRKLWVEVFYADEKLRKIYKR